MSTLEEKKKATQLLKEAKTAEAAKKKAEAGKKLPLTAEEIKAKNLLKKTTKAAELAKKKEEVKVKKQLEAEKKPTTAPKVVTKLTEEVKELKESPDLPAPIVVKISTVAGHVGKRVVMRGWACKMRNQGSATMFVELRDGSVATLPPSSTSSTSSSAPTLETKTAGKRLVTTTVQCVLAGPCSQCVDAKIMARESYLEVKGQVKETSSRDDGIEILVDYWQVLGSSHADIATRYNSTSTVEQLADQRPLCLREEKQTLIFKVKAKLATAIRSFLDFKGSTEVFMPQLGEMEVEGSSTSLGRRFTSLNRNNFIYK